MRYFQKKWETFFTAVTFAQAGLWDTAKDIANETISRDPIDQTKEREALQKQSRMARPRLAGRVRISNV